MWIRNLPENYLNQYSGHDNLIFLWKNENEHENENVYVMDNHLAAAWCWMQVCNAETRYKFIHIDRHNDLGTNIPFDLYRYLAEEQHLPIDEYTALEWVNDGNQIHNKVFRWDNYITQCMYLFPKWFYEVVFSTRTPLDRGEREKLLGAMIHSISAAELLSYIDNYLKMDNDGQHLNRMLGIESLKWIVNLDLDYFYHSSDDGCFQILSDDYIRVLAQKLRDCKYSIKVLTIALSPECCGGWDNAIHALNTFMEVYEEGQIREFPMDFH